MTRYVRAAHDSGPRPASAIKLIVLHSTEGGSADSVARMFARQSATASTHFVVDNKETIRMLPDLVTPWGAPGANYHGLHIEHCGFAAWGRGEWLREPFELERSAQELAKWAFHFGIPLRLLTLQELKAGHPGVITHKMASEAFPPNDGHHDPGPGFPVAKVLARARAIRAQLARKHPPL